MDLGDVAAFRKLDTQDLMSHIFKLPQQLEDAWTLGMELPLPDMGSLSNITIAGMGDSAIGADLLLAYAAPVCPVPVQVIRGYSLPAWVSGPQSLVIALSRSGSTEETAAIFEAVQSRNCRTLTITTGGSLGQAVAAAGNAVWLYHYDGPPHAAVGYAFGLLLAAFHRLGLVPDPSADLREALHAMRNQQTNLLPEVPVAFNPAKRLAGQMMGRSVVVFAAEHIEPVARRWKAQLNQFAKAWGQFEFLPEADHNTLVGLNHPEGGLSQTIALFLEAASNHPQNLLRLGFTRQILMEQGLNTDSVQAKGETLLGHMWTLLHFGDYVAYYLAMAYGEDPTPVDIIDALKDELGKTNKSK